MGGSSIFVKYGLKSGGGAPFLRRTRNAFGQLQTRTRTGTSTSQLQRRTRSCVNSGCYLYWCGFWCYDRESHTNDTNLNNLNSCNIGGEAV